MNPELFTRDDHFEFFKQRYQAWARQGFYGADPAMIAIIEAFNAIPGLTTRFCCQGHVQTEYPKPTDATQFYILFGVTQRGVHQLQQIYLDLQRNLGGDTIGAPEAISSTDITLTQCLMNFMPDEQYAFPNEMYRAFSLEASPTNCIKTKYRFLESVLTTLYPHALHH